MGVCCCHNVGGGNDGARRNEPTEVSLDKGVFSRDRPPDPVELAEMTKRIRKDPAAVKRVTRLQALFRGFRIRKTNPWPGLTSLGVIQHVGGQTAANQEAVMQTEKKLGAYKCEWDVKAGKGTLELRKLGIDDTSGEIYAGYYNKSTGKKEGYGQQLYPNGEKYEGLWKDGLPEGNGRYIYENGDHYAGQWKRGKAEGMGAFVGVDGNQYVGEWKENMNHGRGKETRKDGAVYEGDFVLGKKEGKGRLVLADGGCYEGAFVSDALCGEGT